MYNKNKLYTDIMCALANSSTVHFHYRLTDGLCGLIKNVVNVEVWETAEAVTMVTSDDSKITLPTKIIDLVCIMGDES